MLVVALVLWMLEAPPPVDTQHIEVPPSVTQRIEVRDARGSLRFVLGLSPLSFDDEYELLVAYNHAGKQVASITVPSHFKLAPMRLREAWLTDAGQLQALVQTEDERQGTQTLWVNVSAGKSVEVTPRAGAYSVSVAGHVHYRGRDWLLDAEGVQFHPFLRVIDADTNRTVMDQKNPASGPYRFSLDRKGRLIILTLRSSLGFYDVFSGAYRQLLGVLDFETQPAGPFLRVKGQLGEGAPLRVFLLDMEALNLGELKVVRTYPAETLLVGSGKPRWVTIREGQGEGPMRVVNVETDQPFGSEVLPTPKFEVHDPQILEVGDRWVITWYERQNHRYVSDTILQYADLMSGKVLRSRRVGGEEGTLSRTLRRGPAGQLWSDEVFSPLLSQGVLKQTVDVLTNQVVTATTP